MGDQSQHERMRRKPIMMPPGMIEKVDSIAKQKDVSFAEVVREAVHAFGKQSPQRMSIFWMFSPTP